MRFSVTHFSHSYNILVVDTRMSMLYFAPMSGSVFEVVDATSEGIYWSWPMPCPFCGGDADAAQHKQGGWYVICLECKNRRVVAR